ncbi:efflux RND transporter periplasmic adaptor subunit [Ramlibacter sp. AW1]|uniref:Efflux RND transporter periplasmic adaptor subunit n=1 Tax=Ramlibacter aurantiacus TaxID=2801330 RepID=A0A936ZMK6_9BURK|nr:HlyD family efflux transporter periplasmic adaptor subunit [Ramlibacter aurantiacus]MBL0422537.1 efflux RND transporter periplasmic adaptor subunit [Ramlibacter aurantiacus]
MKNRLLTLAGCALLAGAIALPSFAGADHNHGEAAPAATSNSPKRQPDGSVFLPKNSQRQLEVRTLVTEEKLTPQTVELTGRVLMDANAGGRVQPTQAGRVEAGPRGLPQLGQAVRKGETLAVVRSSASAIERANQQAQTAELRSQLDLARRRAARLAQLEGTVPQKEIEAAQADVQSLQQRAAAVGGSLAAVERLTAPVDGVIAATNVVAGQVVDAREVLFEIVDPNRLIVEALAFDVELLSNIGTASATPTPGVSVPLRFMGAGRTQREGAIPLQFRTSGSQAVPLAVNQPVKVLVQTKTMVKGVPVPAAAVVKSPSNQDMVWVHTGAEQFAPRPIRATAVDGSTVSVVDGLKPGERVVTQGAALINQVR